ncbi:MAG: cytidylate kinase family protein [Spirochaetaceae bacterium]|jgi:cytidylate kinase|nr:cytidylate kinase family protein [Spirochaetaceae bacterium]
MAIITISRELAALGDETVKELSKLSNYRFIDKKALERRISEYGLDDKNFKKYDERKGGFFSILSNNRDDYLHFLKKAMFEEAAEGDCVFIGRGAFAIFSSLPCVLPVFLVSSLEVRIGRVQSYFRCDDKKARCIISKSDNDKQSFHNYFFDAEWRKSENYKLTLNTACLSPSVCAQVINNVRLLISNNEIETKTKERLDELRLAQKVAHHILYEKAITVHFLDVSVSQGVATLYGVVNAITFVESLLEAAKEVDGVIKAVSEIQVIQDYPVFH